MYSKSFWNFPRYIYIVSMTEFDWQSFGKLISIQKAQLKLKIQTILQLKLHYFLKTFSKHFCTVTCSYCQMAWMDTHSCLQGICFILFDVLGLTKDPFGMPVAPVWESQINICLIRQVAHFRSPPRSPHFANVCSLCETKKYIQKCIGRAKQKYYQNIYRSKWCCCCCYSCCCVPAHALSACTTPTAAMCKVRQAASQLFSHQIT